MEQTFRPGAATGGHSVAVMTPSDLTRRALLRYGGITALALLGLDRRLSGAEAPAGLAAAGYGPLVKDPAGLLDLPAGFRYVVLSKAGEEMADGLLAPSFFDGMACFPLDKDRLALVRNHELTSDLKDIGPFGPDNARLGKIDQAKLYDRGGGTSPALGGCSTVVVNTTTMTMERQFLSLAGTIRNCAGGPTPWGSWITCEEDLTVPGPTKAGSSDRFHGFAFEVPASATPGLADPLPLTALGRFRREAVAIDPGTGIVYQTEDFKAGLLYRFIPTTPGKLHAGGKLQALRVAGVADATNWKQQDVAVGTELAVEWVDIPDPSDATAKQGTAAGATIFTRGEGCWWADGAIWYTCTDGGKERRGQIWRLVPGKPDRLTLFSEPNDPRVYDMIDNLTVAPWGDVICAEDGGDGNRLIGVARDGRCYPLAFNALNSGEMAGVCFSPDGQWLFANIFHPGHTVAITGPWRG